MIYKVVWKTDAKKELLKLEHGVQIRIFRKVQELENNPRQLGALKMQGKTNSWRVRVGDYRIIYTIEEEVLVVLVVKVGHRRDVYQ